MPWSAKNSPRVREKVARDKNPIVGVKVCLNCRATTAPLNSTGNGLTGR